MTQTSKIVALSLLVVLLLVAVLPFSAVLAEESSNVLDDLQIDPTFTEEDFPSMTLEEVKQGDLPLLEVIQIAESESKKLYIYVYQPTNSTIKLNATAISMSLEYSNNGQDLNPSIYELSLISTVGVFNKYLVENFQVSDDAYRYYNLVAIYREFNSTIDANISGADGVEKAIPVGQQWCAYYFNDELIYEMGTFETLNIEVKYTGSFEFSSGITIGNLMGSFSWGTSWFIAFNVEDYVVRHIYDAKLSYSIRSMSRVVGVGASGNWNYGEFESKEVRLKDTDTASYNGGGLFAKEYFWNRISSSSDFIKNAENQDVSISEECKSKLMESQWVFAFVETEKDEYYSYGAMTTFQSDIDDVTILTIHFVDINNKIYNLGVVGDRVNPDNDTDGYGGLEEIEDSIRKLLTQFFTIIFGIIAMVVFVLIGFLVLQWIFKGWVKK